MNPFRIGLIRAARHGLFCQLVGRKPRWWDYILPSDHSNEEMEALLVATQRLEEK